MNIKYCLLLILFLSNSAWGATAADEDTQKINENKTLRVNDSSKNYDYYIGVLTTEVNTPTGNVSGFGATVGAYYFATDRLSVSLGFSEAFGQGSTGSTVSIYSGIMTDVSYAIFGQRRTTENIITVDGHMVYKEKKERSWNLCVGAGFDQYWFNGTNNVYPATGFGANISTDVKLMGQWFKPVLKMDMLTSGSSDQVNLTTFSVLFEF